MTEQERLEGAASRPLVEDVYPHGHRAPTDDKAAREVSAGKTLPSVNLVRLAESIYFRMCGRGSAGQLVAAELLERTIAEERQSAYADGFEAGRQVGIAQAAGIIPHPEV